MATFEEWNQWMHRYSMESNISAQRAMSELQPKEEIIEEELEIPKILTISDELQSYCDMILDDAIDITWDLYLPEQRSLLDLKVRMALFPETIAVDATGKYKTLVDESRAKELKRNDTLIKHVSDRIWAQRRHTGDQLRMSIVYIGLVKPSADKANPLNSTTYMIRPLFRTMKCINWASRSTRGHCMVFVDEFGWVYPNWENFVAETLYPDTIIVCPERGVFDRTRMGVVRLTYFVAPLTAEEIQQRKWMNVGMTIGGLAATVVVAGAAVFPITAPFVWAAAAIGLAIGGKTAFDSTSSLIRRKAHEQDISLDDKEARAHWLVICSTVLGFAATGATTIVRSAATAGTVSKTVVVASNTVTGAAVVVNGVSVGNNIFTMTVEDRPVTAAEVLQLSVSLFLFTHSVYNFQTARQMIRETQTQHLSDYKQTLGKFGQWNFQRKMNTRTRDLGCPEAAMGDTIRNLNTTDHYNANFKGTAAYKATTSATVESMAEKLVPLFLRYVPKCAETLCQVYLYIEAREGEAISAIWDVLKTMAERILDQFVQSSKVDIEWLLNDLYQVLSEYAQQRRTTVRDVVSSFEEQESYYNIPLVAIQRYERLFTTRAGPIRCTLCNGARWVAE